MKRFLLVLCIFLLAVSIASAEHLSRSLIAIDTGDKTFLSWRFFTSDPKNTQFNVYRNNQKIATVNAINYVDSGSGSYYIRPVNNGVEGQKSNTISPVNDHIIIPIKSGRGAANVVPGDLDGDGLMDYVIKTPRQANNNEDYKLEAYSSAGDFLWEYDLGQGNDPADNSSTWLNSYTVWDLDGDNKAEVITRSDNSKLTILNGQTGSVKKSITWPLNNQNRYILAIAYLDGQNPSINTVPKPY